VPPVMLFSVFCSLLYLEKTEKDSEFKKISTYNWQRNKSGLHDIIGVSSVAALLKIEALKIYTMPKLPLEEIAATVKTTAGEWENRHSSILYHIDFIEETSEYVLIKGWVYTDEMSMDFTDIYLWLLNGEQSIKVDPYFERRYDAGISDLTIAENCGFFAAIPKMELPPDNYSLGIEIQKRYILPVKKSAKSMETEISHTVIAPNF
jgi:hypothetical protein